MKDELSYLYVIGDSSDGPLKLGISIDPERRVKQLQTGHALSLKIFHKEPVVASKAIFFERLLHKTFHHKRLRGEWFDVNQEEAIAYVKFILIEHDESEFIP